MNDTSPEVETLYREMLMKLSGEERLIRASRSFDAAREIILSSFPPGLSCAETLRHLYERVYGEPLPADFPLPSD